MAFEKSYYYLYDEIAISAFIHPGLFLSSFPLGDYDEKPFSTQKDGSYHTHQLDFVMRSIDDIYASKPGLVIFVKDSSGVGGCDIDLWPWANMVVVQHSATEFSWYVHLKQDSATVNVGDLIGYGTKIGEQGNTGFCLWNNRDPSALYGLECDSFRLAGPECSELCPLAAERIDLSRLILLSPAMPLWYGDEYYVSQNASPPGACSIPRPQVNFYDNTYCNSNLYSAEFSRAAGPGSHWGRMPSWNRLRSQQGWSAALIWIKMNWEQRPV